MPTNPLPTPTTLLTTLFDSLPPSPLPSTAPRPSNPLLSAPPSTKSLFLTLHALFPNEFLPALDLLDRGLVTRVVIAQQGEEEEERGQERERVPGQEEGCIPPDRDAEGERRGPSARTGERERERERNAPTGTPCAEPRDETETENENSNPKAGALHGRGQQTGSKDDVITATRAQARNELYYIQSAAATSNPQRARRSRYAAVAGEKSYEVRLRAWNCSCAAFAFAAFGAGGQGGVVGRGEGEGDDDAAEVGADGEEVGDGGGEGEEWVFGGLAARWGTGGGELGPVCKHLLACVVGERCGLLGGFVVERGVGMGEGAGLGAGWGG